MSRLARCLTALTVSIVATPSVLAQQSSQEVPLEAGWNAVYLEVEPQETSTTTLVARFPQIESIWSYDNRFGGERAYDPEEFVEMGVETPPVRVKKRWRVYHKGYLEASDLFHVHGSRAYLIRVEDGGDPVTWTVQGVPTLTRHYWVPEDYTLTGFSIDPALDEDDRPTFADYFAGSPVHLADGSAVYELTGPGEFAGPLDKQTERIRPGRAYFVYTDGASDYRGVVSIGNEFFDGIDFGRDSVQQDLELRNTEDEPVTVVVRLGGALAAPDNGGTPVVHYFDIDDREWKPLDAQGAAIVLPAGSSRRMRLQARRQGMPQAVLDGAGARKGVERGIAKGIAAAPSCYQGVLEVTTSAGTAETFPVCMEVDDHTGLWIGQVDLRYVRLLTPDAPPKDSRGRGIPDPQRPGKYQVGAFTMPSDFPDPERDLAPELSFPIIVHVAPGGELTLLRHAAVMWKNGRPDDPDTPLDEFEPGRYVIVTLDGVRQGLVDSLGLVGGALRDGRLASIRKTAPTVPGDYALTGGNGEFGGSGTFSTKIVLPALHPLNPFLHRYHPDHGHPRVMNTDSNIPPKGGVDVERTLWLAFDPEKDPRSEETVEVEGVTYRDPTPPGWGDQIIGGIYRELIETLTYDPVVVEGTFRLFKSVRSVKVLNDGAPVK